jgi:hypothetical protein
VTQAESLYMLLIQFNIQMINNLSQTATVRTAKFNISKILVLLTSRLCVVCGFENKQRLLLYSGSTDWLCVTEVDSVYCKVRTESLHKTDPFVFKGLRQCQQMKGKCHCQILTNGSY